MPHQTNSFVLLGTEDKNVIRLSACCSSRQLVPSSVNPSNEVFEKSASYGTRVQPTDPDVGGNDVISAGAGSDIILAGEDGERVVNDAWTSPTEITRRVESDVQTVDSVIDELQTVVVLTGVP